MTTRILHHVAHHFDSSEQEFEASKFGMWLFLVTEVLMFGGLFVAYAVFRSLYPDTWQVCANILDWKMGLLNTLILIASSFSMVLGVFAAQTDRQWLLKIGLLCTILCACFFMVNKYHEWDHEFERGVMPGRFFDKEGPAAQEHFLRKGLDVERAPIFFGLYFTMTGIHGLHIVIGIALLTWLLIRSTRGEFYPNFYTPVEIVGLYWHIVDVIWIFLFPLFYLI
jgi:cytochrome c oxidase subunit 3